MQQGKRGGSSINVWTITAGIILVVYFIYLWNTAPVGLSKSQYRLLPTDGGEIINLIVPNDERAAARKEATRLEAISLSEVDVQWVDILSTGWAAPLRGFMREVQYLQTIHFNSLLMPNGERVSSPIPIVLAITDEDKKRVEGTGSIALKDNFGDVIAILDKPEFYVHRKEERIARTFGSVDPGHPYITQINAAGDWLVGGDLRVLDRIRCNDGLDDLRLTPLQLRSKFVQMGADCVVAFQTRNPTHAAHAFLMKEGLRKLKEEKKCKRPVLWLSPLGGWTKDDDLPLGARVRQHQAIIEGGMLPAADTVVAIWPSPMVYAGPTEVQWHAKARRNAGAGFFITGRDPAGLKRSGSSDDLYNPTDGRTVLSLSPGLNGMEIFEFGAVSYDKTIQDFTYYDKSRPDDFDNISGSKMRKLASEGKDPPKGFMAPEGWKIVVDYYQNKKSSDTGTGPMCKRA